MPNQNQQSYSFPLRQPVICVVGPTASGKSFLAQKLGLALDAEVISADSMQVYRGMDIGTGKLSCAQQIIPHHGFDLVNPDEPFSAALFQTFARACFLDLEQRGKRAILCGGTGLYIRAAIDDYTFPAGEQINNQKRHFFAHFAEEHGRQALWSLLNERDLPSAKLIPPGDVKRVIRALELSEQGISYARQRAKLAELPQALPAHFLGLSVARDILNKRIDRRVEAMVAEGLIDEVKLLLDQGFRSSITASQAIGYKELVAFIEGEQSLDEAVSRIKVATHRYAKRQRTWLRKDKRIVWLCADSSDFTALIKSAREVLAIMGEDQL